MTGRREEMWIPRSEVVSVVGDAAIAGPEAGGLMVPLLILDTSERPDIDEIIRVHSYIAPGDVTSSWGSIRNNPDLIALVLDFIRPVTTRLAICFSIEKQAILVDAALRAKAMYIQAGRPGDRYIHDPDRPKVIIELPEGEFHEEWESIFLNRMTSYFSKALKLSKKKAYPVACTMLEELRKITWFRMPK